MALFSAVVPHPLNLISPSPENMMSPKIFLTLGALNAFLCVALGAFGAHGLKQQLSVEMLAVYQTGVQYHFYHALGLIAVGLVLLNFPASRLVAFSGWLMLGGIILFCLSLYVLSLTGIRALGMITPFGGVVFLTAWALLAYGVWAAR
jgi:uncharacterized membrane protein YgdD (TMEM256/DUF423 family)